jgi:hypothetical protein
MKLCERLVQLLFCIGLSSIVQSEEKDSISVMLGQYVSGNEYRTFTKSEKSLYISGVLDGITINYRLHLEEESYNPGSSFAAQLLKVKQCTSAMNAGQLAAIVDKDIETQPKLWHFPMSNLAWNALLTACDALDTE